MSEPINEWASRELERQDIRASLDLEDAYDRVARRDEFRRSHPILAWLLYGAER